MTSENAPKSNIKIIAVYTIIAAVIFNGGLRIFNIWLSPTGRVLDTAIFMIWIIQIVIFILLILNFILRSTKGEDLPDGWKTAYIVLGIYLFVGLISIPIGKLISNPIQQRGYEAFVRENTFLIEAIEAFEDQNGRPPESLEDLVPGQLSPPIAEINQDRVGEKYVSKLELSFPYESIDSKSADDVLYSLKPADDNDPWQLQVSIYLGSFQSVRFIYNPKEKYSNRYKPVGRWGVSR